MTELGLPPTPENFSKYYRQIAGETGPSGPDNPCGELLGLIRDMVGQVATRTDHLATDLQSQNRTIKDSLEDLRKSQEKTRIMQLLGIILTTATSIHGRVEDAHVELVATKMALEQLKAELNESREQMHDDWLTGLRSRYALDRLLGREVALARRKEANLTVSMLDVDHFKKVNDEFGHEAGDKLLQHLAMIAKAVLRESDEMVRYGGEEFAVILPETDINGGMYVMDRLREAFLKNPLTYEGKSLSTTFSAGLAQLKEGENGHALLLRADAALYRAKQAGRNCVKVAD